MSIQIPCTLQRVHSAHKFMRGRAVYQCPGLTEPVTLEDIDAEIDRQHELSNVALNRITELKAKRAALIAKRTLDRYRGDFKKMLEDE